MNNFLVSTKDTTQYFVKYLSHFLLIWKSAVVFKGKNNRIPDEKEKKQHDFHFEKY